MPTRPECLAKTLGNLGVSILFGIPGIHNLPIYRAFHGKGHKLITVRHEQSAVFMADGFARATGRVAGCLLIDGPGFLNAATAIAQARADSVPMVILTPCITESPCGKLHELPGQAIISKEINRAHYRVNEGTTSQEIADFLNQKLHRERPGPVHIEIPLTLLDHPIEPGEGRQISSGSHPTDPEQLMCAIEALNGSSRPAIVVGGGAIHAQAELRKLAESIGAPVVNTTNAKGLLPNDHPLRVGYSPSFPEIRNFLQDSDVVLAVGTELGETDFDFFLTNKDLKFQFLIRIDIDPKQLHSNAVADIALNGDARQILIEFLQKNWIQKNSGSDRAAHVRESVQQNQYCNKHMQSIFQMIQEQNDVLVGDSSQANYYAQLMYEPKYVRGYFHSVTGFGTLGYGIPAAIGAKIGKPDSNVACLIGDGGAAFTLSEMQTASQLNLGIPFVVWNNQGYGEIDKAMRAETTDRYYESPQPPDFPLLARAFGMKYLHPKNLQDLERGLEVSYEDDVPTIIELNEADFVPNNEWENWFAL